MVFPNVSISRMINSRPYVFLRPNLSASQPKTTWPNIAPAVVESSRAVFADTKIECKFKEASSILVVMIVALNRLCASVKNQVSTVMSARAREGLICALSMAAKQSFEVHYCPLLEDSGLLHQSSRMCRARSELSWYLLWMGATI